MYNLFSEDKSGMLIDTGEAIKKYFLSRLHDATQIKDVDLQNRINLWRSIEIYHNLKLNHSDISERVNHLYEKHKIYLDSSPEKYVPNFHKQCWQNIFELVMADLIGKKFSLIKKNSPPDLIFQTEKSQYFIECSTRAASLIDKYDTLLPDFMMFFKIAELLYGIASESIKSFWYFEPYIAQLWRTLPDNNKATIRNQLGLTDKEDHKIIEKINEWIFWNQYACMYFKKILPDAVLQHLEKIKFPTSSTFNETIDIPFIVRCIALLISQKLEKEYFQNSAKGVIAISLSMLKPGLNIIPLDDIIYSLIKTFFSTLESVMKNKSQEFKNRVFLNTKNLYALVIDNSWYNWFPHESGPEHNNYRVIYNEDVYEVDIFESLISHRTIVNLSYSQFDSA